MGRDSTSDVFNDLLKVAECLSKEAASWKNKLLAPALGLGMVLAPEGGEIAQAQQPKQEITTPSKSQRNSAALLETPAVHKQMGKLYTSATLTWMGNTTKEEYSFTVNADGSVTPIKTSRIEGKNEVEVPAGTQAIVHTHPKGYLPTPGPGDVLAAQKANAPNYVLTQKQLWVANPDGTTEKVGDVNWKHGGLEIK